MMSMKLSTQLFLMGRIGRWIAMAGAAVAAAGLVAPTLGEPEMAGPLAAVGVVLIGFGAGLHWMMGDEEPIPPHVKQMLDQIDEANQQR